MEFVHLPILLNECIDALKINPDGIYVDCTIGGGGHSSEILKRLSPKGMLIGIDKDGDALKHCFQKLGEHRNLILQKSDFKDISEVLNRLDIGIIDGVLMDLGVSSYQIDNAERGFSYMNNAPLDMRMNRNQKLTAGMVLNTYSKEALARIIEDFGEDRFARNIAANIVKFREVKPFETTHELAEVVDKSIPYAVKKTGGHPAKRTFQALRIEVNSELNGLSDAVLACIRRIKKGGRMAVISFHSLEDRIIKNVFKELDTSCICPHGTPICICGKVREVKIVNTKPITPTESEMSENSRAKSAKLRVIEKM